MIDKSLLRLLGSNKIYIFYTVGFMVLGVFANLSITAGICWSVSLLKEQAELTNYLLPVFCITVGIVVRFFASCKTGNLKDILGRKAKKDLRERTYRKIVTLGVRSTDGMSIAGLTQVALEGIEQLDLYYSSVFLCDAGSGDIIFYHCLDRLACGCGIAGLCATDSCFHRGSIQVCKEDLCKILGQIHLHGRQLSGQRAGTEGTENLHCRCCSA